MIARAPTAAEIIATALGFVERHWSPVPLPAGTKGPRIRDWPHYRASEDTIARDFSRAGGIGLLTGSPSNGLVDVDLDCAEAVRLADVLLPATQMISGRPNNPRSHRWYVVDDCVRIVQYVHPDDGDMLVELRGDGGATMVPPSLHPAGERCHWESEGAPTKLASTTLDAAVARLASACLLVRKWQGGARHEIALALSGALAKANWAREEVERYVLAVAAASGDPEIEDRRRAIETTFERIGANEPVSGQLRLVELVGDSIVRSLFDWLGFKFEEAECKTADDHSGTPSYAVVEGAICRLGRRGPEPLCDFSAEIVEEIVFDDGAEKHRVYVLRGVRAAGDELPPARVRASEFSRLDWISEAWGARAIVGSGSPRRDQLREAIQQLSHPSQTTVYRHTGWRRVAGGSAYLFHGGAVGAESIAVELDPPLDRIALPQAIEDLPEAIGWSARLLTVAPPTTTVPLLASIFLAPLSSLVEPDFVPWLVGTSGSFKSELASLAQAHYGSFSRKTLPVSWSSTENAIESTLHTCADALVVVDDYAPQADPRAQRDLERVAARIVRSVGNRSARGRLHRDLTRRPDRPPRGLMLSTGEQLPPGASIQARLVVIEVERSTVDLAELTAMQASAHRLRHSLRGYIEWILPQLDELRGTLPGRQRDLRAALDVGGHMRQADALTQLALGIEMFSRFAAEIGGFGEDIVAGWRVLSIEALRSIGLREARHLGETDPAERFLAGIRALRGSQAAALLPRDPTPGVIEFGEAIGYIDDQFAYLIPQAARKAVAQLLHRGGEAWTVTMRALDDALVQRGYVTRDKEGRATRQVRLYGKAQRVLVIARSHLDGEEQAR